MIAGLPVEPKTRPSPNANELWPGVVGSLAQGYAGLASSDRAKLAAPVAASILALGFGRRPDWSNAQTLMSLFENDQYEWRETYFVLFDQSRRPSAKSLVRALEKLGKGFHVSDVRADEQGRFDSLSVLSPDDYAAMDISYVSGEEVTEQVAELSTELAATAQSPEEKRLLKRLPKCSGRLDVYHFEQTVQLDSGEEEDVVLMDPGALLSVLQRLAELCDGVAIDPQSGILL